MSTVLLLHKDDTGVTVEIPFTWGDNLSGMCKEIAEYMITLDAVPDFYRAAISDLNSEIVALRIKLKDAEKDLAFWRPAAMA